MGSHAFDLSNANYNFLVQIANTRLVSPNIAINGILDDARIRARIEKVKLERDIEAGNQFQLSDDRSTVIEENLGLGHMTREQGFRYALKMLLGGRCVACGQTELSLLEVDHIIPLSNGGTHHPSNLQLLCSFCHAEKTRSDRR